MNSNLAHDVYINQGKAIALANQVDDFLKAKGKVKQIPFGQLGVSRSKPESYTTSQETMRKMMTRSVSVNHPVLKTIEKKLTKEQQRHKFNFDAKTKALDAGQNYFEGKCDLHGLTVYKVYKSGKCHCVECRERTKQLRKEASA